MQMQQNCEKDIICKPAIFFTKGKRVHVRTFHMMEIHSCTILFVCISHNVHQLYLLYSFSQSWIHHCIACKLYVSITKWS